MKLEILGIAFSALRANLLRSLLTMLGIVIGVGAVIAMIALGNGAQQSVKDRIQRLGTTILQVDAAPMRQNGVQLGTRRRMTMIDATTIEERSPHVLAVEPQQDKNFQIVWGDQNTNMTILGVTPNFLAVRGFDIDRGRMFDSGENLGMQRVAVLGYGVLHELNVVNPDAIVGQIIRIGGIQFRVIGTLKEKGVGGGESRDDQVLIPFYTGRFRLFKTDWVDDIFALATSEADLPDATAEIGIAMRRAHGLSPDQPDDFRVRNQADFLVTLNETTQVFTSLLAGIAAVSLLVGGIGIMNIMLVSVTERTREIGVRKALGATKRNILVQFLAEAVTLCLAGGAIGVVAGVGGATIMRDAFGWTTAIGASSIAMAFLFASAVGLLFGVWPARRAAALDPIEALRYE